MPTTDVIVLGLGAMGSAAVYQLARRGVRVVGIEQYTPAHDRGSSHGRSRIIREAYFEHPDYVPLIQRAYELWRGLEQEAGVRLLVMTGGLMIGPPDGVLVQGSLTSARTHHLPYELIGAADIQARFPPFRVESPTVAVQEPNAGVLFPEACVRAHLTGASNAGATLRFEEAVQRWTVRGDQVEVATSKSTYTAQRLIVTAGPWAPLMLKELGLPLQVERNVMYWFQPRGTADPFSPERFPIYIYEYTKNAFFYGFPAFSDGSVKVAHHHSGESCTPDTIRRRVTLDEVARMRSLLAALLPDATGDLVQTATCM